MIVDIRKNVKVENIEGDGYYKSYVIVDYTTWNYFWEEMTDWCLDNFGMDERLGRWHMNGTKFFFEREDDMMMFVVRWS